MKNYYDEQQELKIAKIRRDSLERKREKYFNMTQPQATAIKDNVVMVTPNRDVFLEYVSKIEKIDKELAKINLEIKEKENSLRKMFESLSKMKSKHIKVFLDVFVDGLSISQTAIKESYSESHIYTLIDEIKVILGIK